MGIGDSGILAVGKDVLATTKEMLAQMQQDMYDRAEAYLNSHINEAVTYDEMKETVANKPGFVKAMWCGDLECEMKIKDDLAVSEDGFFHCLFVQCGVFQTVEAGVICSCFVRFIVIQIACYDGRNTETSPHEVFSISTVFIKFPYS